MAGFWDRCAGFYDLSERLNLRANNAMAQAVAEWVTPGSSVLDCAAGTGALSIAAAGRAGRVLCTDLSPAMLAEARKKAERLGLGNNRFARRDIFAPPDSPPFDAAIAGNVLHLLDEPQRAVESLLQAVRPGGRVILPTYLLGEISPAFRCVLAAYRLLGFRPQHSWTLESYRAAFAGWGMEPRLRRIPGRIPVGLAVLIKN